MRGGAGDGSSMVTVPTSASLNVSIFLEKSIVHALDVPRYPSIRGFAFATQLSVVDFITGAI